MKLTSWTCCPDWAVDGLRRPVAFYQLAGLLPISVLPPSLFLQLG